MGTLRVIEIFDSLQGEGAWSGVPMTFVRLAGCNAQDLGLECRLWCDTPGCRSPLAGREMSSDEVLEAIHFPRICLTGGEPLLQHDGIVELVKGAHDRGAKVHLETNGTVESPREFDWVTVSPKGPGHVIHPSWADRIDELKFVVGQDCPLEVIEGVAADHPGAMVFLQPLDISSLGAGVDRSNAERAVFLVMGHPQWRLSVQLHKVLGIR